MLIAKPNRLVHVIFTAVLSLSVIGQSPSSSIANAQTPHDLLQSMVGQKLIMLQFGDSDRTKIKKSDLHKVKISCDIVVQIKEMRQGADKIDFAWEQIGTPSIWGKNFSHTCRDNNYHDKGTLTITGFAPDETTDSIVASVSKVLQTPEQYLATAGIMFNLPAEPDIQGALPREPPSTGPKPLFIVDPAFSEEARKSKYRGTVVVIFYVGRDGRAHRPRISRPLGMGLDQKALDVVSLWRFQPAHKLDQAVPAPLNMEISFNLY